MANIHDVCAHILAATSEYRVFSADQLIQLACREKPWREARGGDFPFGTNPIISESTMESFYKQRLV